MDPDFSSEHDSIEELKKRLDRRVGAPVGRPRAHFSSNFSHEGVHTPEEVSFEDELMAQKIGSTHSFVKKVLFASIAFFIVTLGIAAYFFFSGSNTFSADNIDLSITGPVATPGGKTLTLQVAIANRNPAALETVDFVVEFPEGARSQEKGGGPLLRTREFLDTVQPGQVINKTVQVVLFGQENTQQVIHMHLEYRVPNSNTIFTKAKDYSLVLTSSPVGLSLDTPAETRSGDSVPVTVTVSSNSSEVVKGVFLAMSYPAGFRFSNATPVPTSRNAVWNIGDLAPGQTRTITVNGIIDGQNDETKAFKVSVGDESETNHGEIGTTYTTIFKTLTIVRPQFAADVKLNSSSDDSIVVSADKTVDGEITYTNNLAEQIQNPVIKVKLSGDTIDKTSVRAQDGGFYQSTDNTITWDKDSKDQLTTVQPGDTGILRFSFGSISPLSPDFPRGKNPSVTATITVSGTRLVPGGEAQNITSTITRQVKIASPAQLVARAVYTIGPFKNTGPLPPKVEQKTTYTIIWSVTNPSNDVANVTVEANLPQYVQWLGVVTPDDEKVTFQNGKVTWNVGALRAGTGVQSSAREVAFQISFTPSLAQAGAAPVLIQDALLKGLDSFTNSVITSTQRGLTTSLTTDTGFKTGQAQVVQ